MLHAHTASCTGSSESQRASCWIVGEGKPNANMIDGRKKLRERSVNCWHRYCRDIRLVMRRYFDLS